MIDRYLFSDLLAEHSYHTQYGIRIAYLLLCKVNFFVVLLLLAGIGLSGCTEQPTPYRPPTIAYYATQPAQASATPTSTRQPIQTPLPSATPSCTNNLTFLENISIPDGTVVHPGDQVDKRWLVQNSGSCNWDDRYRLKSILGADLNAPLEVALYPARSGTNANLRIVFTAPSGPGMVQGAWQAYDPQGQPFGDPLNIQVMVDPGNP